PVRDETGEVIRIAGLAEDVTQRRELEKEVVQAQRLKAVGRLAGGLGHEFNNLLTVIRGHLDLLSASHGGDPEVARDVAAAEDAARKAGALTQRLLSFGRRQMLSPSTLDLAAFVRETGAMVRRDLREEVEIEIRAGEAIPVRADPAHLRDVLLTLVSYARDRISDGGRILLSARLTEVESPLIVQGARFPAGRWGVVAVEDDGEAIPEDVALRLFEPFALEGDDEGPRLDLASVHGVVEQSGGGIEVVSDPEIGTRFTVYLPAGSAEGEPAGVSSAASSAPGARDDERP
ncbi:MAG: ATP-binding protein, partial [Longimicrobiales bacterium]